MKKFLTLLFTMTMCFSISACNNSSKEADDNEYYNNDMEENIEADVEPQYDESIHIENGIAYFDMTPTEFVEKFNQTLTTDAEYVAQSLSSPTYSYSGTEMQQVTLYQYDVSNVSVAYGSTVHTFVQTDENNRIMEVVIGLETLFNKPRADMNHVWNDCVSRVVTVLTDLTSSECNNLVRGLKEKYENGEPTINYYKGVMLAMHAYDNTNAIYIHICCMPEDTYYTYHAK